MTHPKKVSTSGKDTSPRKHHYLPKKAYLQFFEPSGKKGQIYLYDKRRKTQVLTSVDNVGCERDLYKGSNDQGLPDHYAEKELFRRIDSGLIPLISKLNARLPVVCIEPTIILYNGEVKDLAMFTSMQMMRTPGMLQTIEQMHSEMAKKFSIMMAHNKENYHRSAREALKEDEKFDSVTEEEIEKARQFAIKGEYDIKFNESPYFFGVSLDLAWELIPALFTKNLKILKAPFGKHFITSDFPVLKIPDKKMPKLFRGGILGANIYFPIGSETALYFFNGKEPRAHKPDGCIQNIPVEEISESIVDHLNSLTIVNAENCVLSGFSDDELHKKLKGTPKPKRFQVG
jgi:hypothetical protein